MNHVIGKNGTLPWHLSDDLKHFKQVTMGHAVIMGRKCHEDIGRPLPGRMNIVVTTNADYTADGCVIVPSIEKAFEFAASIHETECFVIGGASIYEQCIDLVDRVCLTKVHAVVTATGADTLTTLSDGLVKKLESDFVEASTETTVCDLIELDFITLNKKDTNNENQTH